MNSLIFIVHACDKGNNGGCSQVCEKDGEAFECKCNKGFKLLSDKVTCELSKLIFLIYSEALW